MRREHIKPCIVCGKGVLHANNLVCYSVRIQQHIANVREIGRAHGLELVVGDPLIAHVMGTDADLFHDLPAQTILLCQDCFLQSGMAEVWEKACEQADAQERERAPVSQMPASEIDAILAEDAEPEAV